MKFCLYHASIFRNLFKKRYKLSLRRFGRWFGLPGKCGMHNLQTFTIHECFSEELRKNIYSFGLMSFSVRETGMDNNHCNVNCLVNKHQFPRCPCRLNWGRVNCRLSRWSRPGRYLQILLPPPVFSFQTFGLPRY